MQKLQKRKIEKRAKEKKYFNIYLFTEILKKINIDIYGAKEEFEEYIMEYPLDYSAQAIYVSILIRLQEFELAEKILNEIEIKIKTDKKLKIHIKKMNFDVTSLTFSRCALLCHQQRYQELYDHLVTAVFDEKRLNIDAVLKYCKSKLGILDMKREENNSYIVRQIIEYREDDMLNHIKHHLSDNELVFEEKKHSIFESEFPYTEIIKEIKKYMTLDRRICSGLYDDMYIFKYTNCGKDQHKLVDFFKVICFEGSTQIITMYPSLNCEKLPYTDLNYMKKTENETEKIKILSQREKFNKRYKLTK